MKASVKVEILGLDETLNAIEKKYGKTRMNKAKREALEVSARYAAVMLKQATGKSTRTGATRREIINGRPRLYQMGLGEIDVGFSGDGQGQRWRLVHLTEWGYTPHGVYAGHSNASDLATHTGFYAPRGFLAITNAYNAMKPGIKRLQVATLKRYLL